MGFNSAFKGLNCHKSVWVRAYEDATLVSSCNWPGRRGTFYIQ